jgi:ATP-binding cassette, subfamily B, bacterial MsbA
LKSLFNPAIYKLLRREVFTITIVSVLSLLLTFIDAITISILPALLNLIQNTEAQDLPLVLKIWTTVFNFLPRDQQIISLLFIIISGIIVKNVLYGLSLYIGLGLSARLASTMQLQVLNSLFKKNQHYFHVYKTGGILESVMTQPSELGALGNGLIGLVINGISLIAYVILLLLVSAELAIMTMIFALFAVGIITYFNRLMSWLSSRWVKSRYKLSTRIVESVNGIMTIKLFNKSAFTLEALSFRVHQERQTWKLYRLAMLMSSPITEIIGTIFIGTIITWVVQVSVLSATNILSILIAFVVILIRMLIPMKELNRYRTQLASNWAILDFMYTVVNEDEQYIEKNGDINFSKIQSHIQFKDVTFSYFDAPEPALKNINLNIPRGQLTVIIGQSGSGKSTLVNLMLNLYQPQIGVVSIDNEPVQSYTLDSLRDQLAYVQQPAFLFDDTIANNIAFGARGDKAITRADIEAVAKTAIAHEFIMELPDGYDTLIGESGAKLSGGQQQRIAIARAFMRDADLTVLDEATSALDQKTEKALLEQIGLWRKDKTIVLITHRIELADLADHIVVMKHGKIIKQGTPDTMRDKNGSYYWLYEEMAVASDDQK